jgi:hypothetical protein
VAPTPAPLEPLPAGFPAEQAPIVTNLAELKAVVNKEGGTGTLATAIIAPKEGDIPVAPGTPVIVLAKALRDSVTFKKFWRALYLAWGAFWTYVIVAIISAGGLWNVNWTEVLRNATLPAVVTIAAVYGLKVAAGSNDVIVNASLSKGPTP